MPRLILIPDDLEERTRDCCVGAAGLEETFGVLTAYRDLLDASHAAQLARADKHDADNRALGALLDPCSCGDITKPDVTHHYNSAGPCVPTPTDSIGW